MLQCYVAMLCCNAMCARRPGSWFTTIHSNERKDSSMLFCFVFSPHVARLTPSLALCLRLFQMLMLMQLLLTNAGQLLPNL